MFFLCLLSERTIRNNFAPQAIYVLDNSLYVTLQILRHYKMPIFFCSTVVALICCCLRSLIISSFFCATANACLTCVHINLNVSELKQRRSNRKRGKKLKPICPFQSMSLSIWQAIARHFFLLFLNFLHTKHFFFCYQFLVYALLKSKAYKYGSTETIIY